MPRTVLPDARVSPRFAGISTFCRYPRLQDVAPDNRPCDWAIYGVPFDSGVTFRPGARFGPRAIRDASQYVKRFHLEHAVDVCDVLSIADAGDAPVNTYSLAATRDSVAAWATSLADPSTRLFAVGGDHSVAYANIRATWERLGRPAGGLALAHFDAHLDTVDAVWGEQWGHASPFIRAIEDGLVDPRAMVSVGIRGPLNNPADLDFARARAVRIITADAIHHSGPAPFRDALTPLAGRPVYVSFDIDVLDPSVAPGTGTPCPGGLLLHQAFALLRALAGLDIRGGDVVEVLPDRDVSGITALAAAHILFEIIALDAARRR
ncbi:MAG: agmatinase [Planctomycetota bacterium]|nr:agmatinase [Planctomycetota bacterium]